MPDHVIIVVALAFMLVAGIGIGFLAGVLFGTHFEEWYDVPRREREKEHPRDIDG